MGRTGGWNLYPPVQMLVTKPKSHHFSWPVGNFSWTLRLNVPLEGLGISDRYFPARPWSTTAAASPWRCCNAEAAWPPKNELIFGGR